MSSNINEKIDFTSKREEYDDVIEKIYFDGDRKREISKLHKYLSFNDICQRTIVDSIISQQFSRFDGMSFFSRNFLSAPSLVVNMLLLAQCTCQCSFFPILIKNQPHMLGERHPYNLVLHMSLPLRLSNALFSFCKKNAFCEAFSFSLLFF